MKCGMCGKYFNFAGNIREYKITCPHCGTPKPKPRRCKYCFRILAKKNETDLCFYHAKQKIDFAIIRLKEFSLCAKYQNIKYSIEDGNIILGIIYDEVEE